MNLLTIVQNLYINKNSSWMEEVEDSECEPFILQQFLIQNDEIRTQVRFLDQYVFYLPNKMFLSLCWSILPKTPKMPYVPWTKKKEEDNNYDFLFVKIRKYLQLSDNDFKSVKHYLLKMIEQDKSKWFAAFGIEKKYWREHGLNFEDIKKFGLKRVIPQKGLASWGI